MFKFIKSMMWYIKPNWWRYVIILIFGLSIGVLNLLPAYYISLLTKAIAKEGGTVLTENMLIYDIFIPFMISIFAIYIVSTLQRICQNYLTTSIYHALNRKYIEKIMESDAEFFEKYLTGDLLARALGDMKTVKFSAGTRLLKILCESITVIVTFVALCIINVKLAFLCFLPLTFIFISNLLLKRKVQKNWLIVRIKHSNLSNKVLESITNVKTVRAFSKEKEDYNKNIEFSNEAYEIEKKNVKIISIFQPLFVFIVAISTCICYAFGAYYYSLGLITISLLIQFLMYLNLFQSPLTNIGNLISNFYQSLISIDRLNEIYDSKSEIVESSNPIELNNIESIEFKDFTYHYKNDDYDTLKSINFKIEAGKTYGIVGKTASGKSTLVRMLVRQLPIDDTKLLINGKSIDNYRIKDIRSKIAYVSQEHILLSRSVYDNVKIGSKKPTEKDIYEAIKLADFEKDIENLSMGLDTIVGEYGVTLSGGQKQRLSIARAFLKNSDVLVLDDSLSAVDGKTEANIIDTINTYRKNKTNIIVAHRLTAVMQANWIIVLDNGKIVEEGTHKMLMDNKKWYYKQFISQQMEGGEANV